MKYRLFGLPLVLLTFSVLASATDPSLVIDPQGSTRIIKQLIFTKGGSQLVSMGDDKIVRIWDVKAGRTIRTIRDQISACVTCRVSSMALSPDEKFLAIGGEFPGSDLETRFAIYIYNFESGQRLMLLRGHRARVTALAFSPSGAQLASGSFITVDGQRTDAGGGVRIWKQRGQGWEAARSLDEHDNPVSMVSFSPDENQLVSSSHDPKVVIWNTKTGARDAVIKKHSDYANGAVFTPDGRFVITAGADRKIFVWDLQGVFVREFPVQPDAVIRINVSTNKDSNRLLVGLANGETRILSIADGSLIALFKGGDDQVSAAAFSRDENNVASSGGFNGEVWVWRPDDPKAAQLLAGKGQTIWKVGFAKDGNSIAFGTTHTGDAPNGYGQLQHVIHLKSPIQRLVNPLERGGYHISLGGKISRPQDYDSEIVTTKREGNSTYELKTRFGERAPRAGGGTDPVRLYELQVFKDNQKVKQIRRDSTSGRTHRAFSFTSDGRYIVSAGEDGYLALHDTAEPQNPIRRFQGHSSDIWSVAVSPDGRFIVSGSSDQTIKLWDIKREQCLLSFFITSDAEWVAWTPEGYYTSSIRGDRYIGWQVEEVALQQPTFLLADAFEKIFHRPEVVSQYLQVPDIQSAVSQTQLQSMAQQIALVGSGQQTTVMDRSFVFTAQDVKNSLPPKIEIIAPKDQETFTNRLVAVKILVTSNNLPITDVTVSLNGFVKGTFPGGEGSKKVEIEATIGLTSHENKLAVVASHAKASSDPETRTFFFKAPVPAKAPGQVKPVEQLRRFARSNTSLSKHHVARTRSQETFVHGPKRLLAANMIAAAPDDLPTFRIISPADIAALITTANEDFPIEVQIEAVPENTKVRATVNGVERAGFTVGAGKPYRVKVILDEGDNVIELMTRTAGVDSAPQVLRVKYDASGSDKPNLIFLGVGISEYSKLTPPLEYGHKDAEDMKKLFENLRNSPLFNEVTTEVITNGDATHTKVVSAVRRLNLAAKKKNDVRVVLISGHGGTYGTQVPLYYLFAKDQSLEGDPELEGSTNWHTILTRLFESGVDYGQGYLVLLVDTCRAGSASPTSSLDFKRTNGFVFFGSSDESKPSIERDGNGVFTRAVLEGLGGQADGSDPDANVSHQELNEFLSRRLKELNPDQKLQHAATTSIDRFELSFTQGSTPITQTQKPASDKVSRRNARP